MDPVLVAQGPENLLLAGKRLRPVHVTDFELAAAAVFGECVTVRFEETFGEGVAVGGRGFFHLGFLVVSFFLVFVGVLFDFFNFVLVYAGPGFEILEIHHDRIVDDEAAATFNPTLQAFPSRATQRPVPVRHQDHDHRRAAR